MDAVQERVPRSTVLGELVHPMVVRHQDEAHPENPPRAGSITGGE
jgi:hypothetical protein